MKTFDIVYKANEYGKPSVTRRAIVLAEDELTAKQLLIQWNSPANTVLDITDCEEVLYGSVIHVKY